MVGHERVFTKGGMNKEECNSLALLGTEATVVEHSGQIILHILGHDNVHFNDH